MLNGVTHFSWCFDEQATEMSINDKMLPLRKSMLPLYIISKILCTGAFSLKNLRPSPFGTIITICQAIGYCIFHVWSSRHSMSQSVKNMVRQLIDAHNQYCGLSAFCFLVIASLFMQPKIVRIIQNLEDIDRMFQQKLCVAVDNRKWRRFTSILHRKNPVLVMH